MLLREQLLCNLHHSLLLIRFAKVKVFRLLIRFLNMMAVRQIDESFAVTLPYPKGIGLCYKYLCGYVSTASPSFF